MSNSVYLVPSNELSSAQTPSVELSVPLLSLSAAKIQRQSRRLKTAREMSYRFSAMFIKAPFDMLDEGTPSRVISRPLTFTHESDAWDKLLWQPYWYVD